MSRILRINTFNTQTKPIGLDLKNDHKDRWTNGENAETRRLTWIYFGREQRSHLVLQKWRHKLGSFLGISFRCLALTLGWTLPESDPSAELLGYWDQLTGSGAGLIPFSNRTSLGLLSVQQDAAKPNWQPGYHCLFIWIQTEKESSHIKTFYFGSDGGGPGFCLSSALWPS